MESTLYPEVPVRPRSLVQTVVSLAAAPLAQVASLAYWVVAAALIERRLAPLSRPERRGRAAL